ncbi:hypothetical protein SDD30_13025 [Moorella naiadis]|uniref:hypothetical protein n=1 Tax=Moorella naiadis (nom. illeg.) TaxID=3093670 RepID=UPI003D9CA458
MDNKTFAVNDTFYEIDTRKIDERSRVTLGDLFKGYKRVRLYKNDRGEVLLQPVVEIPASEVWLYENKESLAEVMKGLQDAAEGRISPLDLNEL